MARVVLELPEALRSELKEPLGPIETDAPDLLAAAGTPLVAVGDVVTYHLTQAGGRPDLSVFDDRTDRRPLEEGIGGALPVADRHVENPSATLTDDLLVAIVDGLDAGEPLHVCVNGEEDLATLPAIMAVADGASVVYGQPGEGMVHVRVTPETRDRARDLLLRMDGDVEQAFDLLGVV